MFAVAIVIILLTITNQTYIFITIVALVRELRRRANMEDKEASCGFKGNHVFQYIIYSYY